MLHTQILIVCSFIRATLEVDTRDYDHPVVRVEIMIDGKPAYQ